MILEDFLEFGLFLCVELDFPELLFEKLNTEMELEQKFGPGSVRIWQFLERARVKGAASSYILDELGQRAAW